MSTVPQHIPRYTVKDYAHWKGDWELWDGYPIAMSPSPFGRHQAAVVRLAAEFSRAIDLQACDATVVVELDWIVRQNTVVRPDVMVICGPPPEGHLHQTPAIVAEVLSPSTAANDRGFKLDLYREQGVTHYLILDPLAQTTEYLCTGQPESQLAAAPDLLELAVCGSCQLTIELTNLFRH